MGRNTGQRGLLLDFAAGPAPLEPSIPAGTEFDGELAFYPSSLPLRALVKSRAETREIEEVLGVGADETIEAGLRRYAQSLGINPWVTRWPMVLTGVRVVPEGANWYLVDSHNMGLPMKPSYTNGMQLWRLLSASGGNDVTVLAEWDGFTALPLSAINGGCFHDLAPRWAA
jgi:hypothetical protein